MKKFIILVILILCLVYPVFSEAVVKSFNGKVEIKVPGGNWTAVSNGMKLQDGTTISTGFNASLVLQISNATVTVNQLTRMELSQIIASQSSASTDLFLNFGTVEAELDTQDNFQHDFTLKSPICTAAVRGTGFRFDGAHVQVRHGSVELSNNLGQRRNVGAGGEMTGSEDGLPSSTEDANSNSSNVNPNTGDDGSGDTGDDGGDQPTTTTVTIDVVWPE